MKLVWELNSNLPLWLLLQNDNNECVAAAVGNTMQWISESGFSDAGEEHNVYIRNEQFKQCEV